MENRRGDATCIRPQAPAQVRTARAQLRGRLLAMWLAAMVLVIVVATTAAVAIVAVKLVAEAWSA